MQSGSKGMCRNRLFATWTAILMLGLPAAATPHQVRPILTVETGDCSVRVEADDASHTLRLRVLPEYPNCEISKDEMQSILRAAFSKTSPPRLEGTYTSLYIGRLIDFPWLSQYLAVQAYRDEAWNRKTGRPESGHINRYVASLLSRKEVTAQIEPAFGNSGYGIVSVSVEKVLVGAFRDVPRYQGETDTGKVPYDAQVWFVLEKK